WAGRPPTTTSTSAPARRSRSRPKATRVRSVPRPSCSPPAKAHPDQIQSVLQETEPGCALDSMRLSHFLRRTGVPFGGKCFRLLALVLTTAVLLAGQDGAGAADESQKFQLEVFINETPTTLVGTFTRLADHRFAATRAELAELGVKAPGTGEPDEQIVIDDLPGVTFRYDEPEQKIY